MSTNQPCACRNWPSFEGPWDGVRFHHPLCEKQAACHWCVERWPFDREDKRMHVIQADGVYSTVPCLNPASPAGSPRTS
jgi:hypothetical protein